MENVIVQGFIGVLPYLLIVVLVLYGFKVIHDWITKYDDDAELRSGNLAVGLNRGAMYIGLTLAMSGPLLSEQDSFWLDLGSYALEGVIAVVIMTIAGFVFDKVMLPNIDNREEVGKGNMAVALVEAAGYVGLGFIMLSSFAGSGTASFWRDIGSGALFSGLGLVTLMVIYWVFVLVYKRVRKHRVSEELADGNVAMAIEVLGVIVAMSIVLGFSIIGNFTSWWNDILSYLLAAVFGVLSVTIAQVVSWGVFVRKAHTIREDGRHARNLASASINASLLVALGIVSGIATFV